MAENRAASNWMGSVRGCWRLETAAVEGSTGTRDYELGVNFSFPFFLITYVTSISPVPTRLN